MFQKSSSNMEIVPSLEAFVRKTGLTIFVVDDDVRALRNLSSIAEEHGYSCKVFSSARRFLAEHDSSVPGCVIINFAMSDLDGLQLQQALSEANSSPAIIFIADAADIPTSVRAMRTGALDFLVKPINERDLLAAIERAREVESKALQARMEIASTEARLATLTPRERQVLPYVVAGRLNKQIAGELGTVEKTIKVHRARMMTKLGVRTVPDLVRLADRAGIAPPKGIDVAQRGAFKRSRVGTAAPGHSALRGGAPAAGPLPAS